MRVLKPSLYKDSGWRAISSIEILRNSGLYRQHQVIANNFDGFIKMSTEPIQNQRFLAKPLPTHCNYRIYVSKHYEK